MAVNSPSKSPSARGQEGEWQAYVGEVRRDPHRPFQESWERFQRIFAGRLPQEGPPPAWLPNEQQRSRSNLGRLMTEMGFRSYAELHDWTVRERAEFWGKAIERLGIVFSKPPTAIRAEADDAKRPGWLAGAELNIVDSCFRADPQKTAIVAGREGTDELSTTRYGELERLVDRVARGFVEHGFSAGVGVALYMPMTVECVAVYLGLIRAGLRVISIADSFSSVELKRRIEIGDARGIVTVDRFVRAGKTIRLYDKVRDAAAPRAIVIASGGEPEVELREADLLWKDLLGREEPYASVVADPYAVTNVLFSSGTTGDPKAIPWTQLTPIKAAMDGYFHQDIQEGDVVAWPTNIGWMMGPWLIYAALINRASLALYEGLPTGEGFARFVREAGITMLGTVPSLVRAWRSSDAVGFDGWPNVRVFSSTGEPSNREDYLWLMSRAGYRAPVIEYCGGTEIGGGYITGTVVQPASPATFTTPALGLDFLILSESGRPVSEGESGELFLVPPSLGLSETLLNKDHEDVYYAGCPAGPGGEVLRRHGDQMQRLHCGFFKAHGRADDTMNLGGIKVSSLELEHVLDEHEAVYESAAVAVQPDDEGAEALVVYAVIRGEVDAVRLERELGSLIAKRLNPLFKIHDLVLVDRLPRTASNKLMRRELRARYLRDR